MKRKMTLNSTVPATRAVYEVRVEGGRPVQVQATSAGDLGAELKTQVRLDDHASRAAAHLLHLHGVSITAPGWSVRRLGVMQFQPDARASSHARPAGGDV